MRAATIQRSSPSDVAGVLEHGGLEATHDRVRRRARQLPQRLDQTVLAEQLVPVPMGLGHAVGEQEHASAGRERLVRPAGR